MDKYQPGWREERMKDSLDYERSKKQWDDQKKKSVTKKEWDALWKKNSRLLTPLKIRGV